MELQEGVRRGPHKAMGWAQERNETTLRDKGSAHFLLRTAYTLMLIKLLFGWYDMWIIRPNMV